MLNKNFNKLGGTEFRVKSQVTGYAIIANFLLIQLNENENEKLFDSNKLAKKFKEYMENEQIYKYNDKKPFNRIDMVLKLFKQIDLVEKRGKQYLIKKQKLEDILEEPTKKFFELFSNKFSFFKETILFINNNTNINVTFLSATMLIYEEGKDNFSDVYHSLLGNCKNVLEKIILEKYQTNNPCDIEPNAFYNDLRKPNPKNKCITIALEKIKNKQIIENSLIEQLIDTTFINNLLKILENGFIKSQNKLKNKKEKLKSYLKNIKYEEFVMDIHITKIWMNIGWEYADLNKRWLQDFGLIDNDKITNKSIEIMENKISYKNISLLINKYPYKFNLVEENLLKIGERDFSFKGEDENLKEIPNSTIAEYFVNLFFAYKENINPNDFKNFSRTKLTNSLFPLIHAPGKGPDMYLIKNNELIVIETTIHKTCREIQNNEIFPIIEHVNLDNINYVVDKNIKKNITSSKIILITLLKEKSELDKIHELLDFNHQNKNINCGSPRISEVKNIQEIVKNKLKF